MEDIYLPQVMAKPIKKSNLNMLDTRIWLSLQCKDIGNRRGWSMNLQGEDKNDNIGMCHQISRYGT